MQPFQRTLKRPVTCTGIGLHSGKKVNLSLRPAEPDTGIMFKRRDLPGAPLIPGDVHSVVDTSLCTTVGKDGVTVSTVEHLLSALAGVGLDNILIEVDAPEVPIMDGSAAPFVFLVRNAGLTAQDKPRQYYRCTRPVTVKEGEKFVTISPADELSIGFTIDFDHPMIRRQKLDFKLENNNFDKELSRARTFGFLKDFETMRKNNLALGGSLDNAVVVDDYQVLNDDGLRFPDEFVRHKVLDFIGDLSLVGRPIQASFQAYKSGHALNNRLFRKFLADPQAWQLVSPGAEAAADAASAARAPQPVPLFGEAAA